MRGVGGERRLEPRLAVAGEDELGAGREELGVADDEIEPLLRHEPAGHPHQRHVVVLRQAECALDRGLGAPLAREVRDPVVRRQVSVVLRVPETLVDPVRDAVEPVAERAEGLVQTEPSHRRAKLRGVVGAHGDHRIGERHPALEVVDAAVPLEEPPVVELAGESDDGQDLGREVAVERRVVHREHAAHAPVGRIADQRGVEVDRRERGVPVVHVQHHRRPHHPRQDVQRGAREEGEAQPVVGVVGAARAVGSGPVEVAVVLDEEDPRRVRDGGHAKQTERLDAGPDLDAHRPAHRHQGGGDAADGAVQREEDGHVQPATRLPRREPRDGFGEPAGARERCVLGDDVHDPGGPIDAAAEGERWHRIGAPPGGTRWYSHRMPSHLPPTPSVRRPPPAPHAAPARSTAARTAAPCGAR